MANWCSNKIVFEGKYEAITAIQEVFQMMKNKEETSEQGQLPDFITEDNGGYFFNIYWNESDEGVFQYETKWSPNTEAVRLIADLYGVEFTQEYEEMGNGIYGKATYSEGIVDDTALTDEDLEQYQYDEENDRYHFEGEEYESDSEILEMLLTRKLAVL
ncbi:hypothetical protein KRE47_08000 [Elizabethkingia meningoseptica]|uniref:DUF1281 family ferredoxin-like fold protein n=1 Tax=Elizabethkingia meningoseptica TaxID=238 RepID=UPI0023B0BE7A|nr:hypothetical protein [Elizabethkingia meningoseptica]MDE5437619.1 hypothetical protein [Elizabethkingia meningoseptica]MDE5467975.1 hypothetical protein [Elizabethkingia meningoseptica]MDE5474894.1 hypothetical protein [Elizabethkingia meningoseptica]MDE5478327.1 hypothetical protein [Elizabethkingia meningoseptica]MDE5486726.1 hypothetical protein [Elizabethkingia meningoseptica]